MYHVVDTVKGYIASRDNDDNLTFTRLPEDAVKFPMDVTRAEYDYINDLLYNRYSLVGHDWVIYIDGISR